MFKYFFNLVIINEMLALRAIAVKQGEGSFCKRSKYANKEKWQLIILNKLLKDGLRLDKNFLTLKIAEFI